MTKEALAKEASILDMIDSFLPGRRDINGIRDSLLRAVEDYPPSAVHEACRLFSDGQVAGHNNAFMPNGAELATEVRRHLPRLPVDPNDMTDMRNLVSIPIGQPIPDGMVPAGLLEVDFGHGRIDLRKLAYREKDEIMANRGRPKIAAPAQPRLRKMGE